MNAIAQLLRLADEYGRATGLDVTTVSWRLFGDSKKLTAIIGGADIQVRRLERVVSWLSANWPDSAEWPGDIARPDSETEVSAEMSAS